MNTQLNAQQWLSAWHKLHNLRLQPLPTEAEVNAVLSYLPIRNENELHADWIKRYKNNVVPFLKYRVTKLAELRLKAAQHNLDQYPPIPEKPRITPNGAFRFTLSKEINGQLKIQLNALALGIAKYKNTYIGIAAGSNPVDIVVCLRLNANSEAVVIVEDSEFMRGVLCVNPVFMLIEPEEDA